MARLRLFSTADGALVKDFLAEQGTLLLGRGSRGNPTSQRLDSPLFRSESTRVMSQKHAELSWEDDRFPMLTDLKSTNGTVVERDGSLRKLQPALAYRLKDGDIVTLGKQMGGSDDGTPYEPLSLLVEIVSRPSVAQPSTAPYKNTSVQLTLSDSDSDDDSVQIPPSRQPSSARSSSTRTLQSIDVVEIDDDSESEPPELELEPYEPVPRRRAGYGLDTPDLFSDADDLEFVEPEPSYSDADPFEHRERMSPEFDVQSWSAAGSPDADEPTQDYAFAYRSDEHMSTHEGAAFVNDPDGARFEEGGEPYFAEDDHAAIELEPLQDSDDEAPHARPLAQALVKAVADVERVLAATRDVSPDLEDVPAPVPVSSSPPRQTFGDFVASMAAQKAVKVRSPARESRQSSRLPSPDTTSSPSFSPPPVLEGRVYSTNARVIFNAETFSPVAAMRVASTFVNAPPQARTSSHDASDFDAGDYSRHSMVAEKNEQQLESASQTSHLPSPSTSPRESVVGQFQAVGSVQAESDDDDDQSQLTEYEQSPEPIHEILDSDIEVDADADADDWSEEVDDMAESELPEELEVDEFMDESDEMTLELDADLELLTPEDAVAERATQATAELDVEDLVEAPQPAEEPLAPSHVTQVPAGIPALADAHSQMPEEPLVRTLKRPFSTVDFETETEPVSVASIATTTTAPDEPAREIVPLPKRRKLGYGLQHLAFSSMLGFVAGTVVTVAGLASLESMFPQ